MQWKTEARQFQLSLGTLQQSSTANPHVPLLVQLQEELNTSRSLAQLVHVSTNVKDLGRKLCMLAVCAVRPGLCVL